MLIIPIGQEHGEVRRDPWVSYAIIAVNIVVFLALWFASMKSDVPDRFEAKAKEVAEYVVRNPYLQLPPELVPFFGAGARQFLEQARRASPPPVEWVVRRQQQRLNAMAQELFAIARELPLLRHGFVPAKPDFFDALSSMFVHAGLFHLIGNLLFFFATGPFLEDVLGRPLFLLLYLLSGFAALAAHVWQNPGSLAPVVGASGAVAGIMGAFLVRLWRSRIRFLWIPIILIPWIRVPFLVPAFVFLPLWFIAQFLLATTLAEPGGIALWAHVGGFAFGAAAMLLIRLLRVEQRWVHPSIESRVGWSQSAGLVAAMEARGRGDLGAARRLAAKAAREDGSSVDALRLAYDLELDGGDRVALGREAARLLDLYVARGESDLATQLIGEASAQGLEALPLRFHQRAASFLEKQGDELWAARFYRQIVDRHPEAAGGLRALVRLAEISRREGDVPAAREALRRAREHPECSAEWREVVEKSLRALESRPTAP